MTLNIWAILSPFNQKQSDARDYEFAVTADDLDSDDSDYEENNEVQQEREDYDDAIILELESKVSEKYPVLLADLNTARSAIRKVCLYNSLIVSTPRSSSTRLRSKDHC